MPTGHPNGQRFKARYDSCYSKRVPREVNKHFHVSAEYQRRQDETVAVLGAAILAQSSLQNLVFIELEAELADLKDST